MRRKIISLLVVFIILLSNLTTVAFAAEQKYIDKYVQEYIIDSADFLIELNENGSATITETWAVNYKQGSFSRFYKNIYRGVPDDEDFQIKFREVLVDGIPCTLTDDTHSRMDYTYAIIHESDITRYEVYIHSEEEKREFTIKYDLFNVIKEINDDYYLFKVRLLPKGFKKNIEEVTVRVELPNDSCNFIKTNINQGSIEEKGDYATSVNHDIKDLYKVTVRFDGKGVDAVSLGGESVNINKRPTATPFFLSIAIIILSEIKKSGHSGHSGGSSCSSCSSCGGCGGCGGSD